MPVKRSKLVKAGAVLFAIGGGVVLAAFGVGSYVAVLISRWFE